MSSALQQVTAEELIRLPRGRVRHELVKGELLTMSPAGGEHGAIAGILAAVIVEFVKRNRLGVVFGAETGFLLERNPDTVRAPDVAFIHRGRMPSEGLPTGYWPGPPDLAVEILSPGDSIREVDEKTAEWIRAGTQAVWVVSPRSKTVTVYSADGNIATFAANATFDGGAILPGFSCLVADLFDCS